MIKVLRGQLLCEVLYQQRFILILYHILLTLSLMVVVGISLLAVNRQDERYNLEAGLNTRFLF